MPGDGLYVEGDDASVYSSDEGEEIVMKSTDLQSPSLKSDRDWDVTFRSKGMTLLSPALLKMKHVVLESE